MENNEVTQAFLELRELVARLRGPGGCPWDAQQTEETVKAYLLEEAYEVADAVDRRDPEGLCDELGDLLFQILFLTLLAEEKDLFDLLTILKAIHRKMVHRHPHVFGSAEVAGPEEVARNWEKIKKEERGLSESSSRLMESVPLNLPALLRAQRLMDRAARSSADEQDPWMSVQGAFQRLSEALPLERNKAIQEGISGLLICLVALARHHGLNAENLLQEATKRFLEGYTEKETC